MEHESTDSGAVTSNLGFLHSVTKSDSSSALSVSERFWWCLNFTMMQVMLSQPTPAFGVSGAKHTSNN